MTGARARATRSFDGLLAVLVAAAALYSYATYTRLALTRPSLADYDEAATYVRAAWREGDLVDANPFWATRVREYLGDLPLEAFRDPGAEDLERYRRVWLFSLFGAERSGRIRQALEGRAALRFERQFGRVNVRLYDVLRHDPVRYDFRAALGDARVWLERGDERRPCTGGANGRWQCSEAAWNYVGPEIFELAGEPRPVIWAHPVTGASLAVEFDRVPFGRALTLSAGFLPGALGAGAQVELTAEAGGRILLQRFYGPRSRFTREWIETPQLAGRAERVTFRVKTLDDRMRHFCFTAETRG